MMVTTDDYVVNGCSLHGSQVGGRGCKKGEGKREGMLTIRPGLFALLQPIFWKSNYVNCQYIHQSGNGLRFHAWLTSHGNLLCLLPSAS